MSSILLMGNGPSVLESKKGELIDSDKFDMVCRINDAHRDDNGELNTQYKEYVGTRCDYWIINDLHLTEMGWEAYDFLQPVVIDGVCYSHYFVSGVMGRPVSSSNALINKQHMSCVMGHVQDRSISYARRADGKRITGLFAGIFYQHNEEYLNPLMDHGVVFGCCMKLWMVRLMKCLCH